MLNNVCINFFLLSCSSVSATLLFFVLQRLHTSFKTGPHWNALISLFLFVENKISGLARKMEKQFAERTMKKPAGGVSVLPERSDEVQKLTVRPMNNILYRSNSFTMKSVFRNCIRAEIGEFCE